MSEDRPRYGWESDFPAFRSTPPAKVRERLESFLPDASQEQVRAWRDSIPPVGLEFVIRPPLETGPCPGSGRSNAHGCIRHGPPCVRPRSLTRVAFPRRMAPCRVVVGLEVGELPLQITGIPAQHMIQAFSPHRPDQPFHKGV